MIDILVVDDDNDSRRTLVKVLERAGYSVRAVEHGLAAYAALQTESFQAIVCDMRMPFMDGQEFYQLLETDQPEMASHVVFVTGYAHHPDLALFLERTGQPFIAKPYELHALLEAVRRVMAARPHPRGEREGAEPGGQVPDDFLWYSGSASERVMKLVEQRWPRTPRQRRLELAQVLVAMLEPLLHGAELTAELRQACAAVVERWEERTGHTSEEDRQAG